ncbi:MAG: 3-phosphoshikimate 1-carboxyvinyltransferase [Deferribacterota bacterium]|nr:3-phosphoshikimate 1-carboxyvinyltransferase [Deferribacterota bacterium]
MITFNRVKTLKGKIRVPSDKSITHRAFIFSSIATGKSIIYRPLVSADIEATIGILKNLGIQILLEDGNAVVISKGYKNFVECENVLDCMNSGTTARLVLGLLAPQKKYYVLTGDNSLINRPMDRVVKPLKKLGAVIFARKNNCYLPATVVPSNMKGGVIDAEVHSAQVKSAVILAGIQIEEEVVYRELVQTRNHTENMAVLFGADVKVIKEDRQKNIMVKYKSSLKSASIEIPGDFSSAAFFIAAAYIFNDSEIIIRDCGINETRTAFLTVLNKMGASIEIRNKRDNYEPIGDIYTCYKRLNGVKISGDIIPNLIDELPIMAVLGIFANDPVEVRDAKELRFKESDRIGAIVENLNSLGVDIEEYEDGFKVYPLENLNIEKDIVLKSFGDHRIAMLNILLAKRFGERVKIDDINSIKVSNPFFLELLKKLEGV